MYDYFIGIDPGKTGAIVVLDNTKQVIKSFKTPESLQQWNDLFFEFVAKKVICVIEKVHAMPQNGAVASFSFGETIGTLKAVLYYNDISYDEVTPQAWMKSYSMKKDKNESLPQWKGRLWNQSQQIFPSVKIPKYAADAFLIANFCLIKYK